MIKDQIICPICDSKNVRFEALYRNNHSCFQNLNRTSCLDCDLHFSHPMPSKGKLKKYNESFHSEAYGGKERDKKQSAFFSGMAKTRMNFILQNFNPRHKERLKVLEVGPGPGAFLKEWKAVFSDVDYFVIESDRSCHKELEILGATLVSEESILDYKEKFDLLIMSHVLEHIPEPFIFMKNLLSAFSKNAFIFIEVPCTDWKFKSLDESHLLFFDKNPMKLLLNKLNLKTIKISYFGMTIKRINNQFFSFLRRLRGYLWRNYGFKYYHPKRKVLRKKLGNLWETEALLRFDAHEEKSEPSWWIRVLAKKQQL